MSHEMSLTEDGDRVLREAQMFCHRSNVAIVAAEHLLAGALVVLSEAGNAAVPDRAALEAALMLTQGGAEAHGNQVMYGSAARDAINETARRVREAGGSAIDASTLALGVIDSGEVNPMFYGSLGVAKAALRVAIAG